MSTQSFFAGLGDPLSALGVATEAVAAGLAGPAGPPLLALAALGVVALAVDAARFGSRLVGHGARRPAPRASRADRARALASAGAPPTDITRQTGLARDALSMLAPRPDPALAPPLAGESAAAERLPCTTPAASAPARATAVSLGRSAFGLRSKQTVRA